MIRKRTPELLKVTGFFYAQREASVNLKICGSGFRSDL